MYVCINLARYTYLGIFNYKPVVYSRSIVSSNVPYDIAVAL